MEIRVQKAQKKKHITNEYYKNTKNEKKAPTEFDMNNIRSWIVIIFEIFAPIVFFFFLLIL